MEFIKLDEDPPIYNKPKIKQCVKMPQNIPCLVSPLNYQENDIYQYLNISTLRNFIPTPYGIFEFDGNQVFAISNTMTGFTSPCIVEIKLGLREWDLFDTDENEHKKREKIKGTTTETCCVRLKYAQIAENGKIVKTWFSEDGLKMTENEFRDFFISFFENRFDDIENQLKSIRENVAAMNPGFRFYGAAVLISFDADAKNVPIRGVMQNFRHSYANIESNGCDLEDSTYDDHVVEALDYLISIVKKKSKCCLLL